MGLVSMCRATPTQLPPEIAQICSQISQQMKSGAKPEQLGQPVPTECQNCCPALALICLCPAPPLQPPRQLLLMMFQGLSWQASCN